MKRSSINIAFLILTIGLMTVTTTATDLMIGASGKVSVELITSNAQFSNTMSIVSPGSAGIARDGSGRLISGCKLEAAVGLTGQHLLSEKQSQRGCRVELDSDSATSGIQVFASGTIFRFSFCAQTDSDPECEFTWSSNPSLNSDGFDHLRITPIRSTDFPGQIFQLNWEDFPNGGDMDFNDLIAIVRVNFDSDGDGLWDDWERFGIDTDGNGTIDLNLPALGANPLHKDVFLEIDFMDCTQPGGDCAPGDTHSHRPNGDAVNAVIQAFANAPVPNPDGINGITLHIDISNAIPHQNSLNIPNLCASPGPGIGNFDTVKADPANFGPNNPRRFSYRYALFTHQQAPTNGSSGCGELPGNDFQVSLGTFTGGVGTPQQQAGTLMHELGHTLNLQHGGGDSINRKPNYLSIMRYGVQLVGIGPTDPDGSGPLTARVDYSRLALPTLDENNLDETAGISDGGDNTRYRCGGSTTDTLAPGMGGVDWNCDGDVTDMALKADINGDGTLGTLDGFDDWGNLKYDFQNSGDFDDGEHNFSIKVVEMTDADAAQSVEADISLNQSVSASSVVTGTNVTFTIRVANLSPAAALGVVVADNLPASLTFVNCAADGGGVCGGSGNNRTISFSSIAANTTATITLVATVNCSVADGTVIRNSLFANTATVDPVISNNMSSATTTASNPPPVIIPPQSFNAVASSPGSTGAIVNYPAPIVTDNCPDVTLTFSKPSGSVFPLGVTVVTITAVDSGGAKSTASFTITVWDVSIQDEGGNGTLLFNTFTGEYRFIRCGVGGFTFTGHGTISRTGCLIKLNDGARLSASLDRCVIAPNNRGKAVFKPNVTGPTFVLQDNNALGNPPPICQ